MIDLIAKIACTLLVIGAIGVMFAVPTSVVSDNQGVRETADEVVKYSLLTLGAGVFFGFLLILYAIWAA